MLQEEQRHEGSGHLRNMQSRVRSGSVHHHRLPDRHQYRFDEDSLYDNLIYYDYPYSLSGCSRETIVLRNDNLIEQNMGRPHRRFSRNNNLRSAGRHQEDHGAVGNAKLRPEAAAGTGFAHHNLSLSRQRNQVQHEISGKVNQDTVSLILFYKCTA